MSNFLKKAFSITGIIIICSSPLFSQGSFTKTIKDSIHDNLVNDAVEISHGQYILVGWAMISHGEYAGRLLKIRDDGSIITDKIIFLNIEFFAGLDFR